MILSLFHPPTILTILPKSIFLYINKNIFPSVVYNRVERLFMNMNMSFEKLIVAQLINYEIPHVYGTPWFISVFTGARKSLEVLCKIS